MLTIAQLKPLMLLGQVRYSHIKCVKSRVHPVVEQMWRTLATLVLEQTLALPTTGTGTCATGLATSPAVSEVQGSELMATVSDTALHDWSCCNGTGHAWHRLLLHDPCKYGASLTGRGMHAVSRANSKVMNQYMMQSVCCNQVIYKMPVTQQECKRGGATTMLTWIPTCCAGMPSSPGGNGEPSSAWSIPCIPAASLTLKIISQHLLSQPPLPHQQHCKQVLVHMLEGKGQGRQKDYCSHFTLCRESLGV